MTPTIKELQRELEQARKMLAEFEPRGAGLYETRVWTLEVKELVSTLKHLGVEDP